MCRACVWCVARSCVPAADSVFELEGEHQKWGLRLDLATRNLPIAEEIARSELLQIDQEVQVPTLTHPPDAVPPWLHRVADVVGG